MKRKGPKADPVEITIAGFGLARAIANGVGNVAKGWPAIKCKNSEPYSERTVNSLKSFEVRSHVEYR